MTFLSGVSPIILLFLAVTLAVCGLTVMLIGLAMILDIVRDIL